MEDPALYEIEALKCVTFEAKIFIAGDLQDIRKTCKRFCYRGACVTVTPTEYIFTGGSETGAIVGMINYPRIPMCNFEIFQTRVRELAYHLLEECCQRSCTIMFQDESEFLENPQIEVPR